MANVPIEEDLAALATIENMMDTFKAAAAATSRARRLAVTKLEEAGFWIQQDLKQREDARYPGS